MKFPAPTAAILVLSVFAASASADRIESINYPGHFLRHQNSEAMLSRADGSALFQADSDFKLVAGLAGYGVSFESTNYPGHYLAHENYRVVLKQHVNGARTFVEDATYLPRRGLCGRGVSYESANYRDHYIRHSNSEFWIDHTDGSSLFKEDASFSIVRTSVRTPRTVKYTITFRTGSAAGAFGFESAGTDSNVEVELVGDNGASRKVNVNTNGLKCEANTTEMVTLTTSDLGQLQAIRVSKDNAGPGPDWYLQSIQIRTSTGATYSHAGTWIGTGSYDLPL